jgi:polysaccharide deacetylase family protein (PEP-CTERM system associated)
VKPKAADDDPIAGWSRRPVTIKSAGAFNAMTVDVEDYFQVEAFFSHVQRSEWNDRECRIERNVERILQLFADSDTKATFFTLGWVAERYPNLVRAIVDNGHELASHGWAHFRADQQSRPMFSRDVIRAKKLLEDTSGVAVHGYRAASFSIRRTNLWALSALEEAGYKYSSSTFPIHHDLYGMPEQPRFAFYPLEASKFIEIPITTVRRLGANWPSGGGGYFRLLPYALFRKNLRDVRARDKQPCMFYFHPWEIDPEQPRVEGTSFKTRLRHYLNLGRTHGRLAQLLKDFRWNRVDRVYPIEPAS